MERFDWIVLRMHEPNFCTFWYYLFTPITDSLRKIAFAE